MQNSRDNLHVHKSRTKWQKYVLSLLNYLIRCVKNLLVLNQLLEETVRRVVGAVCQQLLRRATLPKGEPRIPYYNNTPVEPYYNKNFKDRRAIASKDLSRDLDTRNILKKYYKYLQVFSRELVKALPQASEFNYAINLEEGKILL